MQKNVPSISIVTSVYKSEKFLLDFIQELEMAIADSNVEKYEIIFVNDGSPDKSLGILKEQRLRNNNIKIIDLSRNFGHHKAVMAGLSYAKNDLVFIIDCDLEVRPTVLLQFISTLRDTEADVVYGVQAKRKGGLTEKIGGALFWRAFNVLSDTPVPQNVLSERLMTRRYVDALLSLGDRNVFLAGMMYWSGFYQVPLIVNKAQRDGRSTYSVRRRISLLVEAVTSFSTVPLRLVLLIGILLTAGALMGGLALLVEKILDPTAITEGFTSLMLVILGLGGMIITIQGVLGLYVSRIFIQSQNRPLFIVKSVYE